MLHSFPRRLRRWLGALLLAAGLLIGGSAPADAATKRPTSVTLSPTADPAHSQTFTWRMTKKRSGQVVQVKAPNGRVIDGRRRATRCGCRRSTRA